MVHIPGFYQNIKRVLDNIGYLNEVQNIFKRDSSREIYIPEDKSEQEKLRQMVKDDIYSYFEILTNARRSKLKSAISLKHYDIVNRFLGSFTFFFLPTENKYGVGRKKIAAQHLIKRLGDEKDKPTAHPVSLSEYKSGVEANDVGPVYLKKELKKRMKVSATYKNLIAVALEIEAFYLSGKIDEAEDVKWQILHEGDNIESSKAKIKFIDLWISGYVKHLLLRLPADQITQQNVDTEIENLIKSAKYVIFISDSTNINDSFNEIKKGIAEDTPYIAIHSLGSATYNAIQLLGLAEVEFKGKGYTKPTPVIKPGREVTVIWYKGPEGLKAYKLLKELEQDVKRE